MEQTQVARGGEKLSIELKIYVFSPHYAFKLKCIEATGTPSLLQSLRSHAENFMNIEKLRITTATENHLK